MQTVRRPRVLALADDTHSTEVVGTPTRATRLVHRWRGRPAVWVVGLCLLCGALPAWAKEKVGTYYPISIETPRDYAGSTEAHLAWRYELTHPGATYIAIHFTDLALAPGDQLTVTDPDGGQAYSITGKGKMGAGTFWSRHIKGDTAVLELVTASEKGGAGFGIDEYVAGFASLGTVADTQAICGLDDKRNAVCYQLSHPTEYDRARAVVRLLINGNGLCTGWLASYDNHMVTNEHCISSASDALNTDYEFMAEAPLCTSPNCQLCYTGVIISGATFVQDNAGLDYSLVQINSGNPAATYGYLEIDNRVAIPGEEIYIPQHPSGRAKELGMYSSAAADVGGVCQVNGVDEPPCSGSGFHDVGYFCDTEGGSSGSPVLARSSHKVISLHHCADCPNRGVPITLVHAEIGEIIRSTGLKVTPPTDLASEGSPLGPFLPVNEVYTITNVNATPINYEISKGQPWVSIDNTGGTLPALSSATVTVSINSNADWLPSDWYVDNIQIINATDHDGDVTRRVALTVGERSVAYEWLLDQDPGWSTEGLWAFGQPTGGGGEYGGPDPTSGATGSNVFGYNLDGDYEVDSPERHLTTPVIDCTGLTGVVLRFQRWLGVEHSDFDHASVRVSNNGTDWTTVWENTIEVTDTEWLPQEIDISDVADNQPTVYLRWTMGTTDGGWQYCGWNLDDVQLLAFGAEEYKWEQAPDLSSTGVDVWASNSSLNPPTVLADDFECTYTGDVGGIVVWGAWLSDAPPLGDPRDATFTLSIHDDLPDPDGPAGPGYSMPGDLLWMREFLPGEFQVEPCATGLTGGFVFPPADYTPTSDSICWKYTFALEAGEFRQLGTPEAPIVYWVDVQASSPSDPAATFGWKTSLDHWNDDAVWATGFDGPAALPWQELVYPPVHPLEGGSIDLAFAVLTGTCPILSPAYPEPLPTQKNRYLSFVPGNTGVETALQVTITESAQFPEAVGSSWWVGEASVTCENSGQTTPPPPPEECGYAGGGPPTFLAAPLQCAQHCTDWGALGDTVQLYGQPIVPDATYSIRAIACGADRCGTEFSPPLFVGTSRWCDVCGSSGMQSCDTGPDGVVDYANDLLGVIDKFSNYSTGLPTARADLRASSSADPSTDQIIDIADYVSVIDAFQGVGFDFSAPEACPP